MKIIGLGNALVDILIQLDSDDVINKLGFPKGSMQLISQQDIIEVVKHTKHLKSRMISGGSSANTIHGLASLGASCGFIGKVGTDDLGTFYRNDLNAINIDNKLLRSHTETGRAFTLISPDSERTFATYLGAAIELTTSDIDISFLKKFDILHIEGYLVQNIELIEFALKQAKDNGLKVSIDLASFNVVEAHREFLNKIIPQYVDIVFANEEESKSYTGKDPEEALKIMASQTQIAIVKIGRKGSLIMSGKNINRINIEPVKSIDTTGAGDQYAAGFLFGLSKQLPLEKCGKLGSLLAGQVVQHIGARIPISNWSTITEKVESIVKADF